MTPATVRCTQHDGRRPKGTTALSLWAGDQSTPILENGFIYTGNESGTFAVLHVGDTLDVVAVNKLDVSVRTTPDLSWDALSIRSAGHLWAFGTKLLTKPTGRKAGRNRKKPHEDQI